MEPDGLSLAFCSLLIRLHHIFALLWVTGLHDKPSRRPCCAPQPPSPSDLDVFFFLVSCYLEYFPFSSKGYPLCLTHSSPWTLLPFICGKFLLLSSSCTSFILVESIYLSVCYLCLINHLYICLPAYLSVHLSTCLSVYLPTYLCVYVCICVSSASSIFIYRLYIICLSYVYLSLFHLSRWEQVTYSEITTSPIVYIEMLDCLYILH